MFSQVRACYRGSHSGKMSATLVLNTYLMSLRLFEMAAAKLCASLESGSVLIF